jgi:hypothetical protein
LNPRTLFWIQGRFVPVGDSKDDPQDDGAQVATILCSVRDNECLEIDSTYWGQVEQAWIDEFKVASWNSSGILAMTRLAGGCADRILKIRFSPPSVVSVNSPVLPMSDFCKKMNNMEQDELVPTRSPVPFQDYCSPGEGSHTCSGEEILTLRDPTERNARLSGCLHCLTAFF